MSWMQIFVLFIAVAIVAFKLWARFSPGARQVRRMTDAYVPNPNNTTRLVVSGWSRAELEHILTDFREPYELRCAMPVAEMDGGRLVITFPDDIEPTILCFLVNYIDYPKGFDLKGRSVNAVAHVELNKAFGIPDASFSGRRAIIYVPTQDTDYDIVYARLDSGAVFKVPFTTMIWEHKNEARLPPGAGND